jgi:hypothetical protein
LKLGCLNNSTGRVSNWVSASVSEFEEFHGGLGSGMASDDFGVFEGSIGI